MADRKKIKALIADRSTMIGKLVGRLEKQVQASQRDLLETVINDFLDGMEVDDAGNIKNTLGNKRRLAMFDQLFTRFAKNSGLELIKEYLMASGWSWISIKSITAPLQRPRSWRRYMTT
jgi:hypothetical protein